MTSQGGSNPTSAVEPQRAATDVKHSKQYPACYQCQQRHVKCSNTLKQTGFPCEACITRGVPANKCMSHFDDPRWIPGVSGATHKRGRAKQKAQRNVKAARQEKDDAVSEDEEDEEDEDDEFEGPTASNTANAGPRRTTRSKLQEGVYRENSGDEQCDVEDANDSASVNERLHGEDRDYAESEDGHEVFAADENVADDRAVQPQQYQSVEVQPEDETTRLIDIERQLGAAAERPAVQMILRMMRERLDKGEQNVIASMRYLLARAAGQRPTF